MADEIQHVMTCDWGDCGQSETSDSAYATPEGWSYMDMPGRYEWKRLWLCADHANALAAVIHHPEKVVAYAETASGRAK